MYVIDSLFVRVVAGSQSRELRGQESRKRQLGQLAKFVAQLCPSCHIWSSCNFSFQQFFPIIARGVSNRRVYLLTRRFALAASVSRRGYTACVTNFKLTACTDCVISQYTERSQYTVYWIASEVYVLGLSEGRNAEKTEGGRVTPPPPSPRG